MEVITIQKSVLEGMKNELKALLELTEMLRKNTLNFQRRKMAR
jgi:hypothetical protein